MNLSSNELKKQKFKFPDLSNKRVLVLGIGGGCDVITAHSVAQMFVVPQSPSLLLYGNTIGPRKDLAALPQKSSYIYAMQPGEPIPIVQGDECYGSIRIEASLPRDAHGSPYLFVVPHRDGSVEHVTAQNRLALVKDIEQMEFDFIFGVDAGGDSLTGGIDWEKHPALGRDRQMLSVLTSVSNAQFYHLMVSPCSDGESSYETMTTCLDEMVKRNHYKGYFECDPLIPTLKEVCSVLSPKRTPNILVRAFQRELEIVAKQSNSTSDESQDEGPFVKVPRGIEPQVPLEWLVNCYVFEWPRDLDPLYCLPEGDPTQNWKARFDPRNQGAKI